MLDELFQSSTNNFRIFGPFKIYIEFKWLQLNTFVLIQESKDDLKIYSSFLGEVFTLTRNHELFLEHFGFIENVFI